MFYVEGESGIDIPLPVVERLARETIHQVDADVPDACIAQYLDSLWYLSGCMAAM